MKFELTKIDPHTCSIEELKKEINRLSSIKEEYQNIEQSNKRFIVSIYGAIGSVFFSHYNAAVAEAVTLQGRDIDKFASKIIDEYFKNEWHLDKELHEKLGLTNVSKLNFDTLTKYMDTDSFYLSLNEALISCDFKENPVDFILKVRKYRLEGYLDKKLDEYAKRFKTKNIQNFELEKISHSAILLAKKKYILDLAWKDTGDDVGIYYKPQEKIKYVGIEIVQSSTSKFARKIIKELLKYTLDKKNELNYAEVVKKLKEYKKEFVLQHPEDVCIQKSIGDYEKYILEDRKEFRIAEKCPINVRAAGYYNFKLQNSKYKSKYELLKTGVKVKYYFSNGEYDIFGFIPNNYPIEFAPSMNFNTQFEKTIIDPYNRILAAIGLQSIPGNLITNKSLF